MEITMSGGPLFDEVIPTGVVEAMERMFKDMADNIGIPNRLYVSRPNRYL